MSGLPPDPSKDPDTKRESALVGVPTLWRPPSQNITLTPRRRILQIQTRYSIVNDPYALVPQFLRDM